MKVRVTNKNSLFYGQEFIVDLMNHQYVGSKRGKIIVKFEDVEFISLTDSERSILLHREILKTSIPKALNGLFYYNLLIDTICRHIEGDFNRVEVIKEDYKELKRVWEKNLLILVDKIPVKINIIGQYYTKNSIDVNITTVSQGEFIRECLKEEEKLEKEIRERNKRIEGIKRAVSMAI
ncbi:hypothetical protein [Caloramator proteoclasticus]|uniref:Uncharacterized protein n=1 Tax=Caloramator proteoclasticus DSM 10124 TaxID=1121262 RepID=A0A1M4X3K6_9CLOT|nr:hypothetical protein [Caloramator proteoclasticus]SHE88035.1 hypothetical protein SAMN02746091_01302 [Caloramator proteoclasticus DSM 10124]